MVPHGNETGGGKAVMVSAWTFSWFGHEKTGAPGAGIFRKLREAG